MTPSCSRPRARAPDRAASSVGVDLPFERDESRVAAGTELQGHELLGAGAHASADIVAADDEIAAVVGAAAHHDMDVRMFGVPMVDRRPNRVGPEIALHLAHQVSGEGPKVGELAASSGETMNRK